MSNTNLIDSVFKKKSDFEVGIFCTYGLNLNFLENYLMKLDGLSTCDDICIFTDSSTYENLIETEYTPRWLNKKYLLNRIKTNGIFHPKLYMLASDKKVIISIGSANLTRDGISSNLELLSVFEISESNKEYASLLSDCINYIESIAKVCKSQSAISQVKKFSEICQPYLHDIVQNQNLIFMHNLEVPIMEIILDRLKDSEVSKIQVISPFYDDKLLPLDILKNKFPSSTFEIYIQQNKSNFPKDILDSLNVDLSLYLYESIERYMHGKAMIIHTNEEIFLYIGSANFTRHALLNIASKSNYEIGILGIIDKIKVENLVMPNNQKAIVASKEINIQVNLKNEFEIQPKILDYITEAKLLDGTIELSTNEDISLEEFRPTHFRLKDFDNNTYEGELKKYSGIELTPVVKKTVPGKMSVQILGTNINGVVKESNRVWVVELEESNKNSKHKRLRRIYNNPFELSAVLQEILKNGDEHELQMFLLEFNISVDLTFPPRTYNNVKNIESKGNISGLIPNHNKNIFKSNIKEAYQACLGRLLHNLLEHVNNPQVNKINNYMMILSSLHSLIWTIGDIIYQKHKDSEVVSAETWSSIRDYYDMLFMYIDHSLNALLGDGEYRDKINQRISNDINFEVKNFEQYIINEYIDTIKEISKYAKNTIKHFENIKDGVKIRLDDGHKIEAMIFESNIHLKSSVIVKIKENIEKLRQFINV